MPHVRLAFFSCFRLSCFRDSVSRTPIPPLQHPQRAEGVPAAGRAEPFKLEIRLPFVRVLQGPAPVLALAFAHDVDRLGEALIARRAHGLEIVESAEDVVVPPWRECEA